MANIIITPSVVPVWDRNTVADGKKMSESLTALSARDECLASAISSSQGDIENKLRSVSSELHNADEILQNNIDAEGTERENADLTLQTNIDNEASERKEKDKNLQEQIDKLNAATDVVAVFGTYDDFTAASAGAWKEQVTDNDVIKVLRDSAYNPPSTDPDFETHDDDFFQVYYQWHDPDAEIPHTDWTGWSAIGNLDPYYSVTETDDIIRDLSATISDNYLSANGEAVQSGHNIVISAHPTEPKIKIETSSHVTFEGVSSTNLSASNASGNLAKFTTLSANIIQGESVTATIDNLINSALSGGAMTGLKNIAGISAENWIKSTTSYIGLGSTADTLDIVLSGGIGNWLKLETEQGSEGVHYIKLGAKDLQADIDSRLEIDNFSNWSGSTASVFSGTSRSAYSSHSADAADNADKLGGVEAAKYMVSTKLYSNTAGVITAYGNSDSKSALGCVGDYVEKSARNCSIGSANNIGTGAEDAFAQGYGNSAVDRSFVQGQFCVANYVSLAEGLNSSAINTAMAQGYNNSAYTNSFAQGTMNTAYDMSIAQGSGNSAYNTSQAFGKGLMVANTGMAIGQYNKTESAAFVIGNGTSSQRSDLFSIDHNGNVYVTGTTFSNLSGNVSSDYIVLPGIIDAGGGRKSIAYDSTGLSAVSEGRGYKDEFSGTWIDILNVANGEYVHVSARDCPIGDNSNVALYDSLAQGYNASAENDSFAQGNTVYANEDSIAQGYNASAKYNSIAQGNNVTASNQGQAFGKYAYAYGGFAVNPGIWTTDNVTTSACNCGFALGNGCYASGNAVAIGYKTSSYDGFAWGNETKANGNSIAMGAYLNTKDRQIQLGWFGKDKSSDGNPSVFSIGYGLSTADRRDILDITKNGVLQLYNPSYPSTVLFQVDSNFMKSTLVNGTVIPLAMARSLSLNDSLNAGIFNVVTDHNAQNYYLFGSDDKYFNIWVPDDGNNYSTTFKLTKAASTSAGTYRLAVGVQSGYTIIFKHFNSPTDNKTIISTGSNLTGAYPSGAGSSGYYNYDSFYMESSNKNTHIYFKSVPSDSEITFVVDNVSKIFSMIKGGWS